MALRLYGDGNIENVTSINTAVSATELGYLDGVSSDIQSQINSSGLNIITSQFFNNVPSASINNCFTNLYRNYRIFMTGMTYTSSGITPIRMRLRKNSTDLSTSTYSYEAYRLYGSAPSAAPFGALSQTSWSFGWASTGANCHYVFDLHNAEENQTTVMTQNSYVYQSDIASIIWATGGGYEGSAYQADGFTIFPESGNLTGTIYVYGYKK